MIMSVSTLIIFSGAATPSSLVNLSIASSSILRFHGGSTAARQGGRTHLPSWPGEVSAIHVSAR
jgi:hypothetical protein